MTICDYAYKKGYTLEQYKMLETNIKEIAKAILQNIKQLHKPDTGIYYPIGEIIHYMADADIKYFIIQELKNLGVEFYDNNSLYRY